MALRASARKPGEVLSGAQIREEPKPDRAFLGVDFDRRCSAIFRVAEAGEYPGGSGSDGAGVHLLGTARSRRPLKEMGRREVRTSEIGAITGAIRGSFGAGSAVVINSSECRE